MIGKDKKPHYGLETRLLKAWPWVVFGGTVVPALAALLLFAMFPEIPTMDEGKRLLQAWFALIGWVVFYWTMVMTLGIGCWIVRVMKGPVHESDSYPLPKPDLFDV